MTEKDLHDDLKTKDQASFSEPELSQSPTEIHDLTAVQEDYEEKWKRCMADFDNFRKRTIKEKEEATTFSIVRFAKDLLSVADNLERAISTCEPSGALYEGILLTQKELEKVFQKFGVQKIDSLHHPFNPHYHQAISEQPSAEYDEGQVLNVLQEGYALNDRLLRPAMVVVAKSVS
jgi:molecular chaperone GrpE